MASLAAGCLGSPPPAPSARAPLSTPSGSLRPQRTAGELVVAVPADPDGFLPGPVDDATRLLTDLLYDPLYRLDPALLPQPALAAALPEVSSDGLTWSVPFRTGATSHAGSPMTAADAAFTLRLAASGACPFERETCAAVAANLSEARAPEPGRLEVVLRAPWAPFLTRVLGTLPVLSEAAVTEATQELRESSRGLDAQAIRQSIERVTAETNAERCLVAAPPAGCRLSDHADELEATLLRAGVRPPAPERSTGADGAVDEEDHGAALLEAVAELASLLESEGIDGLAAGVSLVDVARRPLGGGPFRLEAYRPGVSLELSRHEGHLPQPASLERIRLVVLRDPAVAATALRAGEVDWVLRVTPDQLAGLSEAPTIQAAAHPEPLIWSIIFNVRPGRVYNEAVTRQAFSLCLDREAAATFVGPGAARSLAVFETSPGSWATADAPPPAAADAQAAVALLEGAGWQRGPDGIFENGGARLSSDVAVRTGRADLLGFLRAAAGQLGDCGIELQVIEQDLSTDLLLEQLRWPNEFETLLLARPLGMDPAADLASFEGSRATTVENPIDVNPGGYASPELDALLVEARRVALPAGRRALYGQALALLAQDPASLPIWYEVGHAALSDAVENAAGADIDLRVGRYAWDAWSWQRAEDAPG